MPPVSVLASAVLGYGEISLVLGWPTGEPIWACKRLPPFATAERADAYIAVLHAYLEAFRDRGIRTVDSQVRRIDGDAGSVIVYCVQPALPHRYLANQAIRSEPDRAAGVLGAVVGQVFETVDTSVGLDAQVSNWAIVEGDLRYLDITTPLLRRPDGAEALDTEVFLASLPWAMPRPYGRFVVPGIIERYHHPRTVVLDLAANLIKERLEGHLATVLDAANARLDRSLDEAEVRADYRSDARTWQALQALRRADRLWQQRVRRRPYPFLLPDRIER